MGLEGDSDLLRRLEKKCRAPHWPLYLGRKAFLPVPTPETGIPVLVGVVESGTLQEVLSAHPWYRRRAPGLRAKSPDPPESLRVVRDAEPGESNEVRPDVPLDFAARSFGVRHVVTTFCSGFPVEDHPWFT